MSFPVYRKYPNNKNYFKIISAAEFEEVQVLGNRYTLHVIQSKILPDRNFISDMINNHGGHWVMIDEAEYEQMKGRVNFSAWIVLFSMAYLRTVGKY